MKTSDLIKNLAGELTPSKNSGFYAFSFFSWMIASTAVFILTAYILIVRADLPFRLRLPFFQLETFLFLALFLTTAFIAYRSSIPGLLQARDAWIGLGLSIVTAIVIASRFTTQTNFAAELAGEMDFYRGGCGPVLLVMGFLDLGLILMLARRGASTRPVKTGMWIALSAGSLGLFAMQFVCFHHNFLHIAIWHLLPVGILLAGGAWAGRRLLRW